MAKDPAKNRWSPSCQDKPDDMLKPRALTIFSLCYALTFGARSARATDDPAATPTSAPAAIAQDDDDARLQLAEPDFRLINLPTTLRLPLFKSNFDLTHRLPRLSGYTPGKAQYGFALEKRAGGHMFQLNVTNVPATTLAQEARGGQPDQLALGFNLSPQFF